VAEDLLGRSTFATALADAITGWNEPESLVVALTGPWGSGKSSVTNFVVETLRALPAPSAPEILVFNPWLVAGQGDVASKLLREIGVALKQHDPSAANRQLARKWKVWAAALSLTTSVVDGFPHVSSALLTTGLAALGLTAMFSSPGVERALQVLGVLALAVGVTLKTSVTVAEKARDLFEARADALEQTLDELKADLKSAMAERRRQLVVVVDDIDRLPASEVQLLLRAIRANADFPNLVFLLVFERDVVEKAITDQAHVDGGEYLKKIIQIPFSIPIIDPPRLQKVLFAALDEILDDLPTTVEFNSVRWGNLYFGGLRYYFQTLRDVYRYTTSVDFHVAMFRTAGAMEANQIDVLALEALRVFEPRLWEALPSHKHLLLDGPGRGYGSNAKEKAIAELEELLALARTPESRDAAKHVLSIVFQPIEWLAQNYGFGSGFEEGWERQLRACSEKYFDRYFLLALPTGDVSQAEVQGILTNAGDRAEVVRRMTNLRERGLLAAMLDRLEAYKEKIPLAHAVPFTTAIFDVGDGLPGATGMFGMGADMHAARIVFWYLRRFPSMEEREAALLAAIEATVGIQIPTDVVSMERREGAQKSEYLITEERLPEFHQACAAKIAAAAAEDRLAAHSDMASLLYRWREWGNEADVREWVAALATTTEGAIALVRAFTRDVRSQGMGDFVARVTKTASLKDIEVFIPIDVLASALAVVDRSAVSASDLEVLKAFDAAVRRRRDGKGDRGPLDIDDDE
jgi:predicted KAP-like P-loop ATPase